MSTTLVVGMVPSAAGSPEERRLQQARERLEAVKQDIEQARDSRDEAKDTLAAAEAQVREVAQAVRSAKQAVDSQHRAVERAETRLSELQAAEADQLERSAARALELFKQQGSGALTTLLASGDVQQALDRSSLIAVIHRADRRLFEEVTAGQLATQAQAQILAAEQEGLEAVLDQERLLLAEVEELRDDRELALADSIEELSDLVSQEEHLEAEETELAALAKRAAETRSRASRSQTPSTGATTVSAGSWSWPASGAVTSEFGSRWGRLHAGMDIAAPVGTPVVAARSGSVTHVGRMGGYGNLVLVDHGGGTVTAYAHLSAFSVSNGQRVGAGQRLGAMGCSGSCTGPHLHFEVRVGGSARNPRGYLP